jgi:hypothetical protein
MISHRAPLPKRLKNAKIYRLKALNAPSMDVQSAIHIIEESPDYDEFSKLKKIFKDRLEELKETDFTERGVCYYYLLRIILRSRLMYETQECRDYFNEMNLVFKKQLKKYRKDRRKFPITEIEDFFRLMERSYGSLEIIFRQKDFVEEELHAYEFKMHYRRDKFWFQKRFWDWFEYKFLGATSLYGNSFIRWGLTAFFFSLVLSGVYYLIDFVQTDEALKIIDSGSHWYDYIYFSIVTLTSLGFGDIIPHTFIGKVVVSVEVFFGFIMLGIFISLIQKKM